MTAAIVTVPTIAGMPFQGGFYAGRIRVGADEYAVIVAPKTTGDHDDITWGERGQDIAGARSFFDGHANTLAMAEAGSALARWARELNIDGFSDWYLPSRDELEICYRNLKPTQEHNWPRCGDNPSTIPPSYPYSETQPAQTAADAFQEGGAEAFDDVWYWSSTQYSALNAWLQRFGGGGQDYGLKGTALRARAVRRFKISN